LAEVKWLIGVFLQPSEWPKPAQLLLELAWGEMVTVVADAY
jgi:hypothetical protein